MRHLIVGIARGKRTTLWEDNRTCPRKLKDMHWEWVMTKLRRKHLPPSGRASKRT